MKVKENEMFFGPNVHSSDDRMNVFSLYIISLSLLHDKNLFTLDFNQKGFTI